MISMRMSSLPALEAFIGCQPVLSVRQSMPRSLLFEPQVLVGDVNSFSYSGGPNHPPQVTTASDCCTACKHSTKSPFNKGTAQVRMMNHLELMLTGAMSLQCMSSAWQIRCAPMPPLIRDLSSCDSVASDPLRVLPLVADNRPTSDREPSWRSATSGTTVRMPAAAV